MSLLALAVSQHSVKAAETNTQAARPIYLMPADEGYGVTECLAVGGACAQIVADAWCESHGHARAIAFGLVDDMTASLTDVVEARSKPEAGSYFVTCGE